MPIVIIDSGIDASNRTFDLCRISGCSFLDDQMYNSYHDTNGHGTAVASIIASRIPDADLFCIKVIDENGHAREEDLIHALEYIHNNIHHAVINISAGIIQPTYYLELKNICEKLTRCGSIIVAGYDNNGAVSYPAAFDCVIGVDSHKYCRKDTDFIYVENSIINLYAKGIAQTVAWTDNTTNYVCGSSFAVPYVTMWVYKEMLKAPIETSSILKKIKNIAIRKISCRASKKTTLFSEYSARKAVAFPFNKEIHSLVRFVDQLNVDLTNIYNIKYLGNIHKNVGSLIEISDSTRDYKIEDINHINWQDPFDLFILGHCDEIMTIANYDIKDMIIEKCYEHGKSIFAFDDQYIDESTIRRFKSKGLYIYVPKASNNAIPYCNMNRLYVTSTPIIGIFGTSSMQGKFSLQLNMRRILTEKGYTVGQLGTEPTSELFGFDRAFPIGHNADQKLNGTAVITSVNAALNYIDRQGRDVILAGGQSGCIPYQIRNLGDIPFSGYEYLLAVNPDIIILCVNFEDEIHYIRRCIKYMEGLVDTKVIGLVVFPLKRRVTWSGLHVQHDSVEDELIMERCKQLERELGIPAYINGYPQHMQLLTNDCIDYLSE